MTGNQLLQGKGSRKKEEGSYDGTLQVNYNDPASEATSNMIFDLAYEDVHTDIRNNRIYQYGTYTLSSLELKGLQIILEDSVTDDIQYNKLIFQMGVSPLITMDARTQFQSDYVVTSIPDTAEVYDEVQIDQYQSTFKTETYLNSLSDKFNVDVSVLNELFGYDSSFQ